MIDHLYHWTCEHMQPDIDATSHVYPGSHFTRAIYVPNLFAGGAGR